MARNSTLTRKQRKCIAALVSTPTIDDAAENVGISRSTIARWMRSADFIRELDRQTDQLVDQHVRRMAAELATNLDVMCGIRDGDGPPGVRLRAAALIEQSLTQWTSLRVIERRLQSLEALTTDGT